MASTSNFVLAYNKQDVVAGGALSNANLTPTTAGGGGTGTVTQLNQGTGITLTPSPITGVGTIANAGVTKIISGGSNVTLSPSSGVGDVTISVAATSSGVTQVNTTGTVNGITLSGGPITTIGTVTLGGTLSGIANSQLTNSSVTVTAGTGLSGGGAVSLGGTTTLTNSGVTSVAGAGTVSVSASTGNVTITGSGFSNPMTTLGDTIYENSTPAATRLAGNTGTRRQYLSQTGTGSVSAAPAWTNGPTYNVQDYGILPNGTNYSTAVSTLLSALPANSCIYFPSGTYVLTSGMTLVNNITIKGDGPLATIINTASATAALITSSGYSVTIQDIQLSTTTTRTSGSLANGYPVINIASGSYYSISNVWTITTGYGWKIGSFSPAGFISNCNIQITAAGGIALWTYSTIAIVTGNEFRTVNGAPCVYIQGGFTSNQYVNNIFNGGGALYSTSISSASVSSGTLTLSVGSISGFATDGIIVLEGLTTTSFNGWYKIVTASGTTITAKAVPFFAMPSGTATVGSGKAYTVPSCVIVDNSLGFADESMFSNCQFGANTYPSDPVSVGLLFDGTQSNSAVEGWLLSNNYYDYGKVGVMFLGSVFNTTSRIAITGGTIESNGGGYPGLVAVFISKCPGVNISGVLFPGGTFDATVASTWLYIYSDTSVYSDGCMISNTSLGPSWFNNFLYSQTVPQYGLTIDGALNNFSINNCMLWGQVAAVNLPNSTSVSSTIIKSTGNSFYTGTSTPGASIDIPTLTAASSVAIPWNDTIIMNGSTSVATLTGGWTGRVLRIIAGSGFSFTTGGNIGNPITVNGQSSCCLVNYSGTWYVETFH